MLKKIYFVTIESTKDLGRIDLLIIDICIMPTYDRGEQNHTTILVQVHCQINTPSSLAQISLKLN